MTYAEALKIRNNPTLEDVDNGELSKTIDQALEIADRLEQADAEEMAIRIGCSKCRHTMCRRNPKYEGEQDLFEVRCDVFRRFKNDAILVLADIRGDNNG
jgi:hypothetical protein